MPKNLTYSLTWRNKYLTTDAETIEDMIQAYEEALQQLREMKAAGITLGDGAADDYATLVTNDPEIAERFGFEAEEDDDDWFDPEEDWDEEEEDG